MDTRQLAAFCAVVEKKSFSQAAERLGVTQPAISLQIRSLEERLGRRLLDPSGRRGGPPPARLVLYPKAQRILQLPHPPAREFAPAGTSAVHRTLAIGASTGPGGHLVPLFLCEFQRDHPDLTVSLTISDTDRVIDQVAERELELGVVGALRRHRALEFEPLVRDEIVLAVPPGHPYAGRQMPLEQLRREQYIAMQEGAGVRHVIEEELRAAGLRVRDLESKLELGLQESVKSAVAAGHGVTFISRTAIEGELAAGTLAAASIKGLEPARQIYVVRAAGRISTRAADEFLAFARSHT